MNLKLMSQKKIKVKEAYPLWKYEKNSRCTQDKFETEEFFLQIQFLTKA